MEDKWENIKTAYQEVAKEVLGYKKGGTRNEWLSEETRRLAEERRAARLKREEGPSAKKHHNYLYRLVKEKAKQDKEA